MDQQDTNIIFFSIDILLPWNHVFFLMDVLLWHFLQHNSNGKSEWEVFFVTLTYKGNWFRLRLRVNKLRLMLACSIQIDTTQLSIDSPSFSIAGCSKWYTTVLPNYSLCFMKCFIMVIKCPFISQTLLLPIVRASQPQTNRNWSA